MNTEHQMARMAEHPVPRFEIVHTPLWHVNGVRQPWHARFIGANGETVWTTETYVDVSDAEHAITLLAQALGSQALFEGTKPVKDAPRPDPIAIVRIEVTP